MRRDMDSSPAELTVLPQTLAGITTVSNFADTAFGVSHPSSPKPAPRLHITPELATC